MRSGLQQYRQVYFLGIGGIGMSALARYFKACGLTTAGYDKTSTTLTDELRDEGMLIHFTDSVAEIPGEYQDQKRKNETLVVLTPAIPRDHTELNYFTSNNYTILKRSQVLGLITENQKTFAVAGTHGKTTTSSILAHILKDTGMNVTAFLGGISVNYDTNFIQGEPNSPKHIIVVEADEFDRSFLTLHPEKAIITSMDADHLDIYGNAEEMQQSYRQFASQVQKTLVIREGLDIHVPHRNILHYSIDGHTPYKATHVRVRDGRYQFDLVTPGYVLTGLSLGLPGRHNIENAVAASAIALESGVDPLSLSDALESYTGVQRRFEVRINTSDLVYIDDYAHHPAELRAAILSARELFPGRKLTGVFQPHLYSRTRDFAEEFAESLDLLDELFMLEIYPAREVPIPGITARTILDLMQLADKKIVSPEELIAAFRMHKPDVVMTLGAGDIDRLVEPLTRLFTTS